MDNEQNKSIEFDDPMNPYLEEIAEKLWNDNAAVMVGSGFSKNVPHEEGESQKFPDWGQLGDIFYEQIKGKKPDQKDRYLNVLKLANEVESAFGRPALNQIIQQNIPDQQYKPSELHQELLELPWTDVFTTNYDTLLERASQNIAFQKYDVVISKDDLVASEKPRIVKLHGSLPSIKPFIITEEDYRRYPHDYAAFVNTVQQGLLENTLCLIGFSGDDPNFLEWIGWIRDNLGRENAPKIYMVGAFKNDISAAQKQLLNDRNIVLVDLSDSQGVNTNHYLALKHFVKYLKSKREDYNKLNWKPEGGYISLLDESEEIQQKIRQITEQWKKSRETYPNWCVPPEAKRNEIWDTLDKSLPGLPNQDFSNYTPPSDLEVAFEFNWFLEKSLVPIISEPVNIDDFYEQVVSRYQPFKNANILDEKTNQNQKITKEDEEYHNLDWGNIQEKWLTLILALFRFYREQGLFEKWGHFNEQISQFYEEMRPDQKAFFHYEKVLNELFNFNIDGVEKCLEQWSENYSFPFWEAKRAGILAEIGRLNEADHILDHSLHKIRYKLKFQQKPNDYLLSSQEAYVMVLKSYVKDAVGFQERSMDKSREVKQEFSYRFNELKRFKCEPYHELKLFTKVLQSDKAKERATNYTETKGFDIGKVTKTYHFSSGGKYELLTAYAYLRFSEEIGLPVKIGNFFFDEKLVQGAIRNISEFSSHWAMATLVRSGDSKVVESMFDRKYLAKLTLPQIDELFNKYLGALNSAKFYLNNPNNEKGNYFIENAYKVIPEVLSRICRKCSKDSKDRLLDFLLEAYTSDLKLDREVVGNLTERIITAYHPYDQYQIIPKLLQFPVLDSDMGYNNPFKFLDVDSIEIEDWATYELNQNQIEYFLKRANFENTHVRSWAVLTLVVLYRLNLLPDDKVKAFVKVLWGQTDQYGLPTNTVFHKSAFLKVFPRPENKDINQLFKNYLLDAQFPIQSKRKDDGVSISPEIISLCLDFSASSELVEWEQKELEKVWDKLLEWWDGDKQYLESEVDKRGLGDIWEKFIHDFKQLIDVAVDLIAPEIGKDWKRPEDIKRLSKEFGEYRVPKLRFEAAFLHVLNYDPDKFLGRIGEALQTQHREAVIDGLDGVLTAVKKEHLQDKIDASNFIKPLSDKVKWRSGQGISNSLYTLKDLMIYKSETFTDEILDDIDTALRLIQVDTEVLLENPQWQTRDKLDIRKQAAGLAYRLYRYYNSRDQKIPGGVHRWKNICQGPNEFAAIRNEWLEVD